MNTLTKSISAWVSRAVGALSSRHGRSMSKAEFEAFQSSPDLQKKYMAEQQGKSWWVVNTPENKAKPVATVPKAKKPTPQPAPAAAKPLAGADLTAQRLKEKYPAAAKQGMGAKIAAFSAENREKNLHPFAKAAENIRKQFAPRTY